jgi:uroporphyrinogen-III synthase
LSNKKPAADGERKSDGVKPRAPIGKRRLARLSAEPIMWVMIERGTVRIALFRARDDAARSAARLRALGFSVVRLPAIEIASLALAPTQNRYDAVVATSAKAFLSGAPLASASPLYVVGASTGQAAEARGWRLAAPPARDAAQLIDTLIRMVSPGAKILYLAGRDRKPTLEAALGPLYAVEVVETYAAEALSAWRPAEARALASCAAALHYSRRSAALAARLADKAGLKERFLAMRHICLSNDVAEPLRAFGADHVLVADRPEEAALLAALSEALPVFASDRGSRI